MGTTFAIGGFLASEVRPHDERFGPAGLLREIAKASSERDKAIDRLGLADDGNKFFRPCTPRSRDPSCRTTPKPTSTTATPQDASQSPTRAKGDTMDRLRARDGQFENQNLHSLQAATARRCLSQPKILRPELHCCGQTPEGRQACRSNATPLCGLPSAVHFQAVQPEILREAVPVAGVKRPQDRQAAKGQAAKAGPAAARPEAIDRSPASRLDTRAAVGSAAAVNGQTGGRT